MILITGGSGMIGRAFAEHMLSQKKPVRVQVRDKIAFRQLLSCSDPLLEIVEADFSRLTSDNLRKMVDGCETIVHAAALVHKPNSLYNEYELLNIRATREIAEAAVLYGVKTFVFLSTIAVYGDGPFENMCENSKLAPVTPYAVSKLETEKWLFSFNGFNRTIVLRPSMVYGEGDRGQLLKLIRQIKKGIYFNIGPQPVYKSLIYSKDLCQAINLCINNLDSGCHLFNVANIEPVSLWELADSISNALGKRQKFIRVSQNVLIKIAKIAQLLLKERSPVTVDQIEKLARSTTCSVDKLHQQTGFVPAYDLERALAAEIAWANANNQI